MKKQNQINKLKKLIKECEKEQRTSDILSWTYSRWLTEAKLELRKLEKTQ
jgi:hypothetical protein